LANYSYYVYRQRSFYIASEAVLGFGYNSVNLQAYLWMEPTDDVANHPICCCLRSVISNLSVTIGRYFFQQR